MMKGMKLVVCCFLFLALVLTGLSMAQGARSGSRIYASAVASTLTDDEKAGLLQMREEEKLAHDVYLKMYEKYQKRIFSNIMLSEQKHMDAIKNLLDRYKIEDPAAGKGLGEFTNTEIQALYKKLLAQGKNSLKDALNVGVQIEELDIADLEDLLTQTDNPDILPVYTNLLNGSLKHLSAFTSQLERL